MNEIKKWGYKQKLKKRMIASQHDQTGTYRCFMCCWCTLLEAALYCALGSCNEAKLLFFYTQLLTISDDYDLFQRISLGYYGKLTSLLSNFLFRGKALLLTLNRFFIFLFVMPRVKIYAVRRKLHNCMCHVFTL